MTTSAIRSTLAGCLLAWTAAAGAADATAPQGELFYRYENAEGVTVIDDHVPPKFAHKGYQVLNAAGRVVEVVPRALTDAELRDSSSAAVQERLRQEEMVRQRRYDEMLLTRYSSVDDIEAAKLRRVNEIKVRVNLEKGNIASLKQQLETRQEEAASLERSGETVPAEYGRNIESLRGEIAKSEGQIERLEVERTTTEMRFMMDIERFRILRPTLPSPPSTTRPAIP